MQALKVGTNHITLEEVWDVAMKGRKATLSPQAAKKMERSQKFLLKEIDLGNTHYGVNTGFGLLSNVKIPGEQIKELQYNLLRSHATGVGHYMPEEVVRAMLLLRAKSLAMGYSGVSPRLVKALLALLNKGVHPVVPQQGSVGASGDLAPLAHLALVLIGEGKAYYKGKMLKGADALRKAGLKPIPLGPKEGLALINGTQFMTAIGILAWIQADYLCDVADISGAMSLEAFRGTPVAFSPEIHLARPHTGQIKVAKRLRKILNVNRLSQGTSEIARSHVDCDRVQDPYSLRCIPQVHGSTRDSLDYVRSVLEKEANSVTDNPLVFPEKKRIISGGNFHGQVVATAMDTMSVAVAELGSISEQRIEKLINPALSGLPAFLVAEGGLNSGFMIIQVAAASIVSENKTLAHPASVDSIPTSADKEDHVSMGAWAARKAGRIVVNVRRVLAMELLAAAQGIDLLRPLKSSPILEKVYSQVRKKIPMVTDDRPFHEDIDCVTDMIRRREIYV